MPQRVIIDLRRPLRDFVDDLVPTVGKVPNYVLDEIVLFVFDVFMFEFENDHEEPDLTRLGNFYRDHIENDPRFHQLLLESFFALLKDIAAQLKVAGIYADDGFAYRPENLRNNRSIVVTKLDLL